MSDHRTERESWGPYPLILAGAVIGVLVILLWDLNLGGFVLGGVIMMAAALRFAGYNGDLSVRSKRADVITLAGFGFVLVLTSLLLYNNELKALILSLFAR
ncbi:DUF3017 domain-containing protein [Nonomuraea sp. NPDC049400]|uniref:DUF3017 domain-containing protein n=1 Tax=Nonomuraea sp. NPDC049400 TaxID=3364352 RepID=UPI0037ACE499